MTAGPVTAGPVTAGFRDGLAWTAGVRDRRDPGPSGSGTAGVRDRWAPSGRAARTPAGIAGGPAGCHFTGAQTRSRAWLPERLR